MDTAKGFRVVIGMAIAGISLLLTGCPGTPGENQVDKVVVLSGESQCALPGEMFTKELRLELLGPERRSILGGRSREPVAGQKVALVPVDGSALEVVKCDAASDSGGEIRARIKAGRGIGDQYLKVVPLNAPEKARTVRFITGVKITGARQEALSGNYLDNPLEVKVVDSSGRPAADIPVYFKLISTPEKKIETVLEKNVVKTDADGVATTQVRVGGKTGIYMLEVEVAGGKQGSNIRGIELPIMGLDLWSLLVTVAGGLAIFIFGMKLMSDGLQMVAGERMKAILHFFTSNRVAAVLAGTAVTAVVQSSSACTVMVVGFVNAGLLNLTQAIGIVFGANIGTTVTAQIISFNLSGMALPAITIGMLITMLAKNNSTKGWGEGILGFGLLFFGMGLMEGELKIIGRFPMFINFFNTFDCTPVNGWMPLGPVFGALGIGLLVTAIIQSSSAAMGIVLALAAGGLINFYTSFPLLLGTNIGTTVTAMLAALPANRRAKQAALAHLLFNFLGAFIMLGLLYIRWPGTEKPIFLYLVNSLTRGDAFAAVPQNLTRHIAMAHTMFNVIAVASFLPAIALFVRLCNLIIPVRNEAELKITYLEPTLLNTPSVALEQVINSLRFMVKESWAMVSLALNDNFLQHKADDASFIELETREEKIDSLQAEITEYLVQLTRRELTPPQSDIIPLLMHCTNDAERIADHSCNIFKLAKRLVESEKEMSSEALADLKRVLTVLSDQSGHVIAALHNNDKHNIVTALKEEDCIDGLVDDFEARHIQRLRSGDCDAIGGIIFIEMLAEMERIGDHLTNIAERAPEMQKHYFALE